MTRPPDRPIFATESPEVEIGNHHGTARCRPATDATGRPHDLVSEIFVRDITWWGEAGGPSTRDWTLYEVHREGDLCLVPSSAYGCVR